MPPSTSTSAENVPSPATPYFTPTHAQSPGTPVSPSASTPTLLTPLTHRSVTLKNRIVVAPMCQYSTAPSGPQIGALTDYHIATLGHYALKGAALVFVEATGVQPNGRISPNCPGLWSDAQIEGLRRVADFCHAQGALCGIQLAHAGRKASTAAPWVAGRAGKPSIRAPAEVGGWPKDVVGPMGGVEEAWDLKGESEEGGYYPPRQLSEAEIKELVGDWAAAAKRAVQAGVDVIEIHGAHGYLVHQFLSPITNRRTDRYGGSLENRSRLLFEIIEAVRGVIPESMPLWLRLSATEWMEESDLAKKLGSWDLPSTIEVAKRLPNAGIDLLDVSSGGNHPKQSINMFDSRDYQTRMAGEIRKAVREAGKELLIGAVGLITEAEQARDIVQEEAREAEALTDAKGKEPRADVVLVARQFMREPEWVLRVAHELGVDVAWPSQFLRVRFGGKNIKRAAAL